MTVRGGDRRLVDALDVVHERDVRADVVPGRGDVVTPKSIPLHHLLKVRPEPVSNRMEQYLFHFLERAGGDRPVRRRHCGPRSVPAGFKPV